MEQNSLKAALLVLDMQVHILKNLVNQEECIHYVRQAISGAREKKLLIIYSVVGFRPGMPEINMANKSFAASKERMASVGLEEWTKIHPSVAPKENDVVVTKKRISAFTGSDLEVILRSQGIQHLVLSGVSTSGVILSTVREAADKDYKLTVLSDACADADEEVHRVLTTKIFLRQAEVMKVGEWVKL